MAVGFGLGGVVNGAAINETEVNGDLLPIIPPDVIPRSMTVSFYSRDAMAREKASELGLPIEPDGRALIHTVTISSPDPFKLPSWFRRLRSVEFSMVGNADVGQFDMAKTIGDLP